MWYADIEIGKSIEEAYRWAKAYGVPVILFNQIENIREPEITQDTNSKHHRNTSSSIVLKARKILANLERIKKSIQSKRGNSNYLGITGEDITRLDKTSEITTSEICSDEELIRSIFEEREDEQK